MLCVGLILAEDGRKMSKHLANVLEPVPLMQRHGADALRWFMAATGSPWAARRVGHAALEEIVRKVLLTYWNTVSFLVLYANAPVFSSGAGWDPSRAAEAPLPGDRPLLDRWVLSELHATVRDVTAAMEAFDTALAGRLIASFIDDLSNWYVRRSRRRFWEGPGNPGSSAAFATLHECLLTVSALMAPLTPFLTDYVWGVLRSPAEPDSVHLASWPAADESLIDEELRRQMAQVRRLVELGRAARASSSVRTRQPLARALVGAPGFAGLPPALREQVAEELNVHSVDPLGGAGAPDGDSAAGLMTRTVKPNFRALGRRFGSRTQPVARAIGAADPDALVSSLRADGSVVVEADGDRVTLVPEELVVTETPRSGWAVATEAGETVALDLAITGELRREGLAREVVRLIQDARKNAGLDVSDRIDLWWSSSDPEVSQTLGEHGESIAGEVLAVTRTAAAPAAADADGLHRYEDTDLSLTFWLRRA